MATPRTDPPGPAGRPRRRFGRVRQLPSGRWQAGYVALDGTTNRADTTFPTRAAADRWLSVVETDLLRGEWTPPQRRVETVGVWTERWLNAGVRWRPTTRHGYEVKVNVYVRPRWGDRSVNGIKREEVQDWVSDLLRDGVAPATVRHAVGTVSRVLRHAMEAGAIANNPCQGVRLPRSEHGEMRILTIPQVEALAESIYHPVLRRAGHGARPPGRQERPDLALAVRLATYTGLRAGELWALRRQSIDLPNQALRVTGSVTEVKGFLQFGAPKSGRARAIPIPTTIVGPLRQHLVDETGEEPEALVFTSSTGTPVRHSLVYRRHFQPALRRAGLPEGTRWHDLRHTYAALLIAQGAHPRAIMERMGHSSITVTLGTYGHLLPSLEQELTDRLDSAISREIAEGSYCT